MATQVVVANAARHLQRARGGAKAPKQKRPNGVTASLIHRELNFHNCVTVIANYIFNKRDECEKGTILSGHKKQNVCGALIYKLNGSQIYTRFEKNKPTIYRRSNCQ
jgi:hypothetical protein